MDTPLYLQALLSNQEDTGAGNKADSAGDNSGSGAKGNAEELMDTSVSDLDKTMDGSSSVDSYENPFLKAPKRSKSKP